MSPTQLQTTVLSPTERALRDGNLPSRDKDVTGRGMTEHIEPLASALWFQRIEKIANGEMGSIENALRHAAHLLQLTPVRFRDVVRLAIEEEGFEALLEAGDFDAAARHLIAQPAALAVDEDAGEACVRATISCVILNRAIDRTGDTVASAVLAAWTTCLLALKAEYGADLLSGSGQPERRDRSERGRRLH